MLESVCHSNPALTPERRLLTAPDRGARLTLFARLAVSLNYRSLLLVQRAHQLLVHMLQVFLHELGWGQRHQLVQRHLGEALAPEHLQKTQRLLTGVLDVVSHSQRHVAHVTRLVIESARRASGREHRHATLAFDEVHPLVVVRVPVHLAHPARLDLHQRRRDGTRGGEVGGVGDAHLPATGLDRLLRQHPVAQTLPRGAGVRVRDLLGRKRPGHLALVDVSLLRRDIGKSTLRHAEVRSQHVLRRVREPVGQREGAVLGEVAIVEDEQELAFFQSLERVRDAGGEVPQVAHAEIIDGVPPVLVDRGDPDSTIEHESPLGLLVPVHLAHPARRKAHIHTREGRRDRQLTRRYLPRPATLLQSVVGIGKGELQVGDLAGIGLRRGQHVRVLPVPRQVARTGIGRADTLLYRLRHPVGPCGVILRRFLHEKPSLRNIYSVFIYDLSILIYPRRVIGTRSDDWRAETARGWRKAAREPIQAIERGKLYEEAGERGRDEDEPQRSA